LAENFSENNLKGDLPNVATFNPPLFSLVNTFKQFRDHGSRLVVSVNYQFFYFLFFM
jgi:hypothetical protein